MTSNLDSKSDEENGSLLVTTEELRNFLPLQKFLPKNGTHHTDGPSASKDTKGLKTSLKGKGGVEQNKTPFFDKHNRNFIYKRQPNFNQRKEERVEQFKNVRYGASDDNKLPEDMFSLMMLSDDKWLSRFWIAGFFTFVCQIGLCVLILVDQIKESKNSTLFNVPYNVDGNVRAVQFLSILFCIALQNDIITSIQSLTKLWKNGGAWKELKGGEDSDDINIKEWMWRICIPNLFKLIQGLLVIFVSFVVIIQSDNVIDLLKDFTTLLIVSEIDNLLFKLAIAGYLSKTFQEKAKYATDIDLSTGNNEHPQIYCIRSVLLISIALIMISGWGVVVEKQSSGDLFDIRYPKCKGNFDLAKEHFGDGECWGGELNSIECEFEGGDCINFNLAFPSCKNDNWTDVENKLLNDTCDEIFSNRECLFDNYACCNETIVLSPSFGDNKCTESFSTLPNATSANTKRCLYDNGDCVDYNENYCNNDKTECCPLETFNGKNFSNGICEDDFDTGANTELCQFDGNDCLDYNNRFCHHDGNKTDCCHLNITQRSSFGNGICDDEYNNGANTELCQYDGDDCLSYNNRFCNGNKTECCPLSTTQRYSFDNGICEDDFGSGANTELCQYDGDDCLDYNNRFCHHDGNKTDCCLINITKRSSFGNGICDDEYNYGANTELCQYDGYDCLSYNSKFCSEATGKCCPLSTTQSLTFGRGACNERWNTGLCFFDLFNCIEENFIKCNEEGEDSEFCACPYDVQMPPKGFPEVLGNDKCQAIANIRSCSFDMGDCNQFNRQYPECGSVLEGKDLPFERADIVFGNGVCEGGAIFNLDICDHEYGDCDIGQVRQDLNITTTLEAPTPDVRTQLKVSLDGGTVILRSPRIGESRSRSLVQSFKFSNDTEEWLEINATETELVNHASIAISRNGTLLAVLATNKIEIYKYAMESKTWNRLNSVFELDDSVDSFDMSADGSRLVITATVANRGRYIKIYDINSSLSPPKVELLNESIGSRYFYLSADGSRILLGVYTENKKIRTRVYEGISNGTWTQVGNDLPNPLEFLESAAISKDGSRVAIASNASNCDAPGEVQVFDFSDGGWKRVGEKIYSQSSKNGDGFGHSMVMSEDGKLIAVVTMAEAGSVQLFSAKDGIFFVPLQQKDIKNPIIATGVYGLHLPSVQNEGHKTLLSVANRTGSGETTFLKMYDLNDLFIQPSYYFKTGLRVKYYPGVNSISTRLKEQNISPRSWELLHFNTINFPSTDGAFATFSLGDNFAAWFEGYVDFSSNGKYELKIDNDDEARIYINDELILQNGNAGTRTISVVSTDTGFKKVAIEFHEGTSTARLIFKWKPPGNDGFSEVPFFNLYRDDVLVEDTLAYSYSQFRHDSCLKVKYYHDLDNLDIRLKDQEVKQPYSEQMLDLNTINFPRTEGYFATSGIRNRIFAWFEGYVDFSDVGKYTISANCDDSVVVYINDVWKFSRGSPGVVSFDMYVSTIGLRKVSIDFAENTGAARLVLMWSTPSSSSYILMPFEYAGGERCALSDQIVSAKVPIARS